MFASRHEEEVGSAHLRTRLFCDRGGQRRRRRTEELGILVVGCIPLHSNAKKINTQITVHHLTPCFHPNRSVAGKRKQVVGQPGAFKTWLSPHSAM